MNQILSELQQQEGIISEQNFNQIVGKSIEKICASHSKKTKELLVIFDESDGDLASVIDMRYIRHCEKNTELILLNATLGKILNTEENKNLKLMIKKFSMLHHWSLHRLSTSEPESIVQFAVTAIEKMPILERVVMRGRCSAITDIDLVIKPKKCKVISQKHDISAAKVNENEFLFQQISVHSQTDGAKLTKTYLKFHDVENNIVIKELMGIPINTYGNKLSPRLENEIALAAKENDLPLMVLSSLDGLVGKIRNSWLRNEAISKEDKNLTQAVKSNARTFTINEFPIASLAGKLNKTLKMRGINADIKAYAAAYSIYPKAGILTSSGHGHQTLPKAFVKLKK